MKLTRQNRIKLFHYLMDNPGDFGNEVYDEYDRCLKSKLWDRFYNDFEMLEVKYQTENGELVKMFEKMCFACQDVAEIYLELYEDFVDGELDG